MKTLFLFLLATALPLNSFAAVSLRSAVLKCPAIPEDYSKMLTQLNALKTTIKETANCKPVQKEVDSLEKLLNERRSEVLDLVKKSDATPLSSVEQDKIRLYAQDATVKVFNTIELLNRNNYCFSEDKPQFDFNSLSSITLDATAILKSFGGVWSAPIALGGQVLAGVFQGIGQIMNNQIGYNFDKINQRENFVRAMCTYYSYRQDIENLLYPEKRLNQLEQLRADLQSHMNSLSKNCPQCQEIFSLDKQAVTISGQPNEVLYSQMNSLLSSADSEYKKPLGSYTATAITTQTWLDQEIKKIQNDSLDFNVGRDLISEMRSDFDVFLFEKQGPAFINWQNDKTENLLYDFNTYVSNEGYLLLQAAAHTLKTNNSELIYGNNAGKSIDYLFNARQKIADLGQEELAFRIDAFYQKSLGLYDATIVSYNVMSTYCNFFKHAGVYNRSLNTACEGYNTIKIRASLDKIKIETRKYKLNMLSFANKEYSTDWAETLSNAIRSLNNDPSSYLKKQ